MDTRSKIVDRGRLAEIAAGIRARGGRIRIVRGPFDVLLATHVRRLRALADGGATLVVEIGEPPQPLLAARARAELVAALEPVDYVVLGRGEAGPGDEIVEEGADHERAFRELVRHVHERRSA